MPTQSADDWKRLLAKPDLHWKAGYSAMTLARCWEAADPEAPPEILATLDSTGDPALRALELLVALPEYQVELPGGQRSSQTDVLAMMRGASGLVAVAVEGKVDEAFGPTVGEKRAEASAGVQERLAWLEGRLGLDKVPDAVRYQLLHRTVSALIVAEQFRACAAVMLVHSFSPTDRWFDDFEAFAQLLGARVALNGATLLGDFGGMPLYIGWSKGHQRFRERV